MESNVWVWPPTHTVTHTPKQPERAGEDVSSSPALSGPLCYSTCAMKFPIFSAAFSCIRRLVWV